MFGIQEIIPLGVALIAGAVLGGFYFGGLWWTVGRLPTTPHPLKFYFGSLAIRASVLLVVLAGLLLRYEWPLLVACLVGLLAVRFVLIHYCAATPTSESSLRKVIP